MKESEIIENAAAYYTDFSKHYDDQRRHGYFRFISELEFEKISPHLKNAVTLEIGCGTGLILQKVDALAEQSIGVDVAPGMINVCRKKGLNCRLIDGGNLPFSDNRFDLVYAFKTLPHVPNIKRILAEASRVSRRDGVMVLEFYNAVSIKACIDFLRRSGRKTPVYIRHDTLSQFLSYMPPGWRLCSTRGVRIFAPAAFCYRLPVISRLFRWLDRKFCETPFIHRLGGYFIAEFRRGGA